VHHLWLQFLHILGVDNASGAWYLFWSGVVGDVTILAAILVAPYLQWKRHACQVQHCWRFGRHSYADPDEHVARMLCYRHHPGMQDRQLTARHLQERHHLYLGKKPGRG
jgi:hypothetical protein